MGGGGGGWGRRGEGERDSYNFCHLLFPQFKKLFLKCFLDTRKMFYKKVGYVLEGTT